MQAHLDAWGFILKSAHQLWRITRAKGGENAKIQDSITCNFGIQCALGVHTQAPEFTKLLSPIMRWNDALACGSREEGTAEMLLNFRYRQGYGGL
jgi:hypothetical protein